MYCNEMFKLGDQASPIRALFNYGQEQAKIVGPENIFDFTIGNPSIPLPKALTQGLVDILQEEDPVALHSYSLSAGRPATRQAIIDNLNDRFGTDYSINDIYMTCGAAAALCSTFAALTVDENSEFIAMAPYFAEYKNFVETKGGKFVTVPNTPDFRINFEDIEKAINQNTQAVIINSPNNPSGKVFSKEELEKLAEILTRKSEEFAKPIYIVTDEPYRELVYGGLEVSWIPSIYKNTIVCYSYSKIYSMPGERIGYFLVPPAADDATNLYKAIAGAARTLGYVCAPVLFQNLLERFPDPVVDLGVYETNRDLLYQGLTEIGYEVVSPDGAFFMFVKAPCGDGSAFSQRAMKEENLLIVPGAGFGCPEYVRLSYAVPQDRIERGLPLFKKLFETTK